MNISLVGAGYWGSKLQKELKSKQVNIKSSGTEKPEKEASTISIQDLKDLNNQKVPKSNRKQKSSRERNTISLDL